MFLMRLHRFFSYHIIDKERINYFSNSEVVHQIRRVFRLHVGDKAIFFDGTGVDFVSEIVSMESDKLGFKVHETQVVKPHSSLRLTLAMSLIKKDNFEWVIEKGTELGVSEFVPIISERSEKKNLNMERARKILIEATEQSGRSFIPEVKEPIALEDFLNTEKRGMIVFHTEGSSLDEEDISKTADVVAFVGPEGGWSEKEIEMFRERGAAVVKLHSPILRAETAAVAISTLLLVR
jgi:16S rRNA (uracil1498-N3)-methyltransferase